VGPQAKAADRDDDVRRVLPGVLRVLPGVCASACILAVPLRADDVPGVPLEVGQRDAHVVLRRPRLRQRVLQLLNMPRGGGSKVSGEDVM
jgi:hypothetical protein